VPMQPDRIWSLLADVSCSGAIPGSDAVVNGSTER
jgi:hypothetical protein